MAEKGELIEENKREKEDNIEEEFDHLDLSINLRKRPDLRKKMTPEMKKERQKKQKKELYKKSYAERAEYLKAKSKRSYEIRREKLKEINKTEASKQADKSEDINTANGEAEDFDHLDLTIDLRKRSDLRKKMTPEMKKERSKKIAENFNKKKYLENPDIFKDKSRDRYHQLNNKLSQLQK